VDARSGAISTTWGTTMNDIDPNSSTTDTVSPEERQWGMFAHLSMLAAGLLTSPLGGWGWFLGPLIIWLMKKDTMPFVADQAKEALNFSLLVTGIFVILMALGLLTLGIGFLITMPIMVIVGIAALILTIIAAMKANEGIRYRYPFNIRFIK
jgi:uncharacterized Tic20 family protein